MIRLSQAEQALLDTLWHVLWDHLSTHRCIPVETEDHQFVGPRCFIHDTLCRNLFSLQYDLEARRQP